MRNRFIICVLSYLITGCITPYNIENNTNHYNMVVNGNITQKNAPHEIILRYSNSIGSTDYNPIINARIKLFDGKENYEEYVEVIDGRYVFYGEKLQRAPGTSYYIEIELSNQKVYRSKPQIMPEVMKPEKLYYETEKTEELYNLENIVSTRYLNIYINTPIIRDNQNYYFTWRWTC